MKYAHLLTALRDDVAYTPAKIVRHAAKQGEFASVQTEQVPVLKTRIRIRLAHFARDRGFPKKGDQLVILPGQPAVPGWYGWRWKQAAATKRSQENQRHLSPS